MNAKNLVTAALVVFVLVSLGVFVANETGLRSALSDQQKATATQAPPPTQGTSEEATAATPPVESAGLGEEGRVIAYYFHNTSRCPTCLKIERTAREAMEEVFAEDFACGRLVWQSLDMEQPENQHFVYDYELAMPSLVLVLMEEETEVDWKRLDDTWALIRNKEEFVGYVVEETSAYLGEH